MLEDLRHVFEQYSNACFLASVWKKKLRFQGKFACTKVKVPSSELSPGLGLSYARGRGCLSSRSFVQISDFGLT